jgi:DNA-binding transcriptional MocR family regulator
MGAQQGMNLLARLFFNPGGQVLLAEVTYPDFPQVLMSFRPDVLNVPADGFLS